MKPITVVISQGQSHNPAKRRLEEEIAAGLGPDSDVANSGIAVMVVPNLYDLTPNGTIISTLRNVEGNIVVLSWMYSRAAHWLLDRQDIRGQVGEIELTYGDDDDDASDEEPLDEDTPRVIDEREQPDRSIYCLDFRASEKAADFVEEVQRIARESHSSELLQWIKGDPSEEALNRYLDTADPSKQASGNGESNGNGSSAMQLDETAARRWYPVIDFSRCTNCMECIDFCLFGVYGVDQQETILVEQPDNCRKGCPACSRVCPENAIIFPQHKTPAIAGAQVAMDALKIDLSKLFGAPEGDADALEVAARERDEQLLLAGREAVGMTVGVPKRQEDKTSGPKDDLDELLDELDELD